jgi:homoserine O-acetyltransferase
MTAEIAGKRNERRVTGAWMPGDPPGHRQFLTSRPDRPFALERGGVLTDVTVAYETWGRLDERASNAVLICHAWTGDSHVTGAAGRGHPEPGWWEAMVGPGRPLDTDRWFVVCSNILGGCQGTTGPSSPHPVDGRPYGSRFPALTVRDMVRAQARLADHLGVARWHSIVGGSLGGMQALEWAIMYPHRVRSIVPIATCMRATAQQIAWGSIGRRAIRLDPRFRGGDYYEADPSDGPDDGLAIARMVAQVTFRSDNVFTERFGRDLVGDKFEVERYLEHHGTKLTRRFDTNSYLVIGTAMDLHDVSRGRGSVAGAMGRVQAASLSIGISSDLLYPNYQQREIDEVLRSEGVASRYVEIDSPHGHDAFLINVDQVGEPLADFLDSVGCGRSRSRRVVEHDAEPGHDGGGS